MRVIGLQKGGLRSGIRRYGPEAEVCSPNRECGMSSRSGQDRLPGGSTLSSQDPRDKGVHAHQLAHYACRCLCASVRQCPRAPFCPGASVFQDSPRPRTSRAAGKLPAIEFQLRQHVGQPKNRCFCICIMIASPEASPKRAIARCNHRASWRKPKRRRRSHRRKTANASSAKTRSRMRALHSGITPRSLTQRTSKPLPSHFWANSRKLASSSCANRRSSGAMGKMLGTRPRRSALGTLTKTWRGPEAVSALTVNVKEKL